MGAAWKVIFTLILDLWCSYFNASCPRILSLCLWNYLPTFSILDKLLHTKTFNFMYPDSYGDKLWFISIHIGSKYQQGNVTPDYIRLGMWSSWNQTSNSLAWKIKLPTYPSSLRDASNVRSSGNSLTTLYISPVPSLEYSRDNCTVMDNFQYVFFNQLSK